MRTNTEDVVAIVISLIVIAVIMPLGLGMVAGAGSMNVTVGGVTKALSLWVDPAVLTLLTVLLPILAVISVTMYFIKGRN